MNEQPIGASDELLTADDVGAKLKVSAKTVKRMVEANKFPPPIMVNSRPRWTLDDVRKDRRLNNLPKLRGQHEVIPAGQDGHGNRI